MRPPGSRASSFEPGATGPHACSSNRQVDLVYVRSTVSRRLSRSTDEEMHMRSVILALALAITLLAEDPKTRVFVSDSASWEVSGGFGIGANGGTGAGAGRVSGGARPQTVEIIKTFSQRCPAVTITLDKTRANYIVLLDRDGGKDVISRDNKIAVFRHDGDLVHSGSTRSLGNAVLDACSAIRREDDRRDR
jgi:hypothetical protein